VGPFYPPGTRASDWLALYARAFDAVEVDSTYYALPPPERFDAWREQTPDDFLFTLKMPGEVTHELRLEDPRLAFRFCDDARRLGPKLGVVLIQLPPSFGPARFDAMAAFLRAMPDDVRFAIEFRDRAWFTAETLDVLRETGTMLAVSAGPWLDQETGRAVAGRAPGRALYLRWMGAPRHQRRHGPALVEERDGELAAWADRIRALPLDEVYAFFNNDYQGHSPMSARRLQALVGQAPVSPDALSPQRELFE
jgi:uncharacterized protein YecE (DUF72 family)